MIATTFGTEGTGTDIYAARLDAAGNVIGSPFMINQTFGDQVEPQVAWNGEHWLVVWKRDTHTLPTYETVEAVRVAHFRIVQPMPLDARPGVVIHLGQEVAWRHADDLSQ